MNTCQTKMDQATDCKSTLKTASTARPVISKIPHRTSIGWCPNQAVGLLTMACEYAPRPYVYLHLVLLLLPLPISQVIIELLFSFYIYQFITTFITNSFTFYITYFWTIIFNFVARSLHSICVGIQTCSIHTTQYT